MTAHDVTWRDYTALFSSLSPILGKVNIVKNGLERKTVEALDATLQHVTLLCNAELD